MLKSRTRRTLPIFLGMLLIAAGGQQAWAHTDPSGATATGVTLEIRVHRTTDGVTKGPEIPSDEPITECETVIYRIRLAFAGGSSAALEGGKLFITTPDGVRNDVTPVGGIPCLGGTTNDPNAPGGRGTNCLDSPTEIFSQDIAYTVDLGDPGVTGGFASALGEYGDPDVVGVSANDGFAHRGVSDLAGVTATIPIDLEIITCDDGLPCNGVELCDPTDTDGTSLGLCQVGTPVVCDDLTACTTESCNTDTGACDTTSTVTCDDGSDCTTESCNTDTGACDTTSTVTCDDGSDCTTESCNTDTGACDTTSTVTCDDGSDCTTESCNTDTGACDTTSTVTCDDGSDCTTESCNTDTGACDTTSTVTCDDGTECTTESCNTDTGACDTTSTVTCGPDLPDACCDPEDGICKADPNLDPTCGQEVVGCRITGGRIIDELTGELDPLQVTKATGGGQVGAPCGCIGCFDPETCGGGVGPDGELEGSEACIQGNWEHSRKKKQGSFQATYFNSLQCGCECEGGDGALTSKLDGDLCNEGNRVCGPEPRRAPANLICFSGTGKWSATGNKKTVDVAFRVEAEDHGEPGGGSDKDATEDEYRIWIYIPQVGETIKELAAEVCCQSAPTDGTAGQFFNTGRPADVFDGTNLVHGNLQIHPQIASHIGECPVPNGECPVPDSE